MRGLAVVGVSCCIRSNISSSNMEAASKNSVYAINWSVVLGDASISPSCQHKCNINTGSYMVIKFVFVVRHTVSLDEFSEFVENLFEMYKKVFKCVYLRTSAVERYLVCIGLVVLLGWLTILLVPVYLS